MAPGRISPEVPEGGHSAGKPLSNGHTNGEMSPPTNGDKPGNVEETKEAETREDEASKSQETSEESDTGEAEVMKCEFKHLDRRYDEKDEQYIVERKDDTEKPEQKDWWRLFAFCVVRHYNSDGEYNLTRLYINPQPIRQLLFDVIGNYPSSPISLDDTFVDAPYYPLFHYKEKLEAEGRKRFAEDEESLAQFNLLMSWISSHFELEFIARNKCVNGDIKAISYDHLWTVFRPGTLVHCKLLDQRRAFKTSEIWYDIGDIPGLNLRTTFVDFDGDKLGTRQLDLFIPKYLGTQELSELPSMPLDLLDDAAELREELRERGRLFESYVGQNYLEYNGIAVKKVRRGYARFSVIGRVMIDCNTFHRIEANDSFSVDEFQNDQSAKRARARRRAAGGTEFRSDEVKHERLSDEDLILTNSTVRGYSFTVKKFLEFFVDKLSAIRWNTRCFDDLVLDASIKKTVQALVSTHSTKREAFDDIVKGKGQGLVCVLHGPPGVGKTLTAECVAEYVQRPLYLVSSGDLGVTSADLDRELTKIMDMTSTWRAVLLIDEADVFLERRSLHEMHRNSMVSVFLRVLEYYAGILFLTTNRVTTFDDAFKSRIHIPIRYTDLSVASRTQIWRNFIRLVPGGVDIDECGLALLAEHDLNGRQIKNVVKAAESLAAFDGVRLDFEQLQQVTRIQATFEKDLTSLSGIDYTAPGASRKDAESRAMFL